MWGLGTIKKMNNDAGILARGKQLKPFLLHSEDQLKDMPPFPFPNFGDEAKVLDEQYEKVDSLFVDKSGFGSSNEPALTLTQLVQELQELLDKHGSLYLAIEEEGQFQLYVGVWREHDKV